MDRDLEQLRLLSIFHYVVGGLAAAFSFLPLIHFTVGLLMATGRLETSEPALRTVGALFMVMAGLFIVAGWAMAAAIVVAGRFLARRRHYTFCLVVPALECLFVPFGTVLGVFTIVVLMRDSVKALFEGETPPSPAEPAG